jgi:hypothetical protein
MNDPMAAETIGVDGLTFGGAQVLADKINRYWRERGYGGIRTQLVKLKVDTVKNGRIQYYAVRSNLVRGFPPTKAEA